MVTLLIAEPDDGVADLIEAIARRVGLDVRRLRLPLDTPPPASVLVVEPDAPEALALARSCRDLQPGMPIVCASIRRSPAGWESLEPFSFVQKPFHVKELARALLTACEAVETTPG